jgi:hypothetical protein
VPVDQVVNDVLRAFHHPALRDEGIQIQRDMFATVRTWVQETRHPIDQLLSSESVKAGRNHILKAASKTGSAGGHNHGTFGAFQDVISDLGHGKVKGSLWSQIQTRDLNAMGGADGSAQAGYMSSSPAPRPTSSSGFGYQHQQPPPQQQGQAASYYAGAAASYSHAEPPVPEPGYGGAGYAYGQQQQQQQPPQGGQWGYQGPPPPGPPPGYGGAPGYGQGPPPPFPPYGGQPPHQQGPGWNQNSGGGGYPGAGHRW